MRTNLKLALALLLGLSLGCSQPAPPSPPSSADSSSGGKKKKKSSSQDDSSDSSSDDSSDNSDSSDAGGTPSPDPNHSTSADNQCAQVKSDFNVGGASVGSDTDKASATKCLTTKMFFDRFTSNGAATCTALPLARVDCTSDGLMGILSANQQTQLQTALQGDYAGWQIDQCLDCPPNSTAAQCKNSSGDSPAGTKVFFVKEDSGAIHGKTMVLPIRPFADCPGGAVAPTASASPAPSASPSPAAG